MRWVPDCRVPFEMPPRGSLARDAREPLRPLAPEMRALNEAHEARLRRARVPAGCVLDDRWH